jgi:5'-3' exonuclease
VKTLLLDGEWNLKRNFKKRVELFSNGEHCGGSFGFLESLRAVVNKVMPDRAITFWDGKLGGKLRHDIYPNYKQDRNKSWDEDSYILTDELISEEERKNKYSITLQKLKVRNYLEELFVRQVEVETIEADDLIALYVNSKPADEEIIIFSSDKDYYQLIGEGVSVLRPSMKKGEYDNVSITINNFKEKFGYTHENILALRCFEGDVSDSITGVDGIAEASMIKNFPRFADEVYTIDRLIEEAVLIYSNNKKKPKFLEKIIGSRRIFERNKRLMDLKHPFINEDAVREVSELRTHTLIGDDNSVDRSISNAMKMMVADGYHNLVWNGNMEFFCSAVSQTCR